MIRPKLIVLDAGHGMANKEAGVYDSGAVSRDGHKQEASLALAQVLTLKHYLSQIEGVTVFLTRTDETSPVPLSTRVARARLAGADAFLSVHFNSGGGSGTETFYREGFEESKEWATLINAAAVRGLKKSAGLVSDMFLSQAGAEGKTEEEKAAYTDKAARARVWKNRGVKIESESPRGKLAVLAGSGQFVSALLEVAFMDSDIDMLVATTRAARIYVAEGIKTAIESL